MKLIFVRNPITPDKREITYSGMPYYHDECLTVAEHLAPYIRDWSDTDFSISINGHVIFAEEWSSLVPGADDCLVVHPVLGKGMSSFFNSVLNLALAAFVFNPAFLPYAGWARPLLQVAGMYVGGRVINAIVPLPKQSSSESQDSTTYGWNGPQPTSRAGTCVGKTYGTAAPSPVLLARFVTSDSTNQYLNLLFSGGEGPVDSIDDIMIDGNPYGNYANIQIDTRLGTNDQDPIADFHDTVTDYQVASELDTAGDWVTKATIGTAVEGLQITIEFPYGLYFSADDGSLAWGSVTVEAQYQLVGAGTWTEFPLTNGGYNVNDVNTATWNMYRLDNIPAGQYNVRMRCTNKSGTSNRHSTRVFWVILSEIIYKSFAYPNKVLVGIRALATNQLSSSDPTVTWTQTRSTVNVWNPNTSAYQQKRASNPAWACYDMIHQAKYLKNINTGSYEYIVDGKDYSRIDYNAFAAWADYADGQVNDDNRFNLNIFLSEGISFWDALARFSIVGRGVVLPKGTIFSCICDMPGESTQLFTVGNITAKSFKGEFQSTKDRANSVEITFPNKDKQYSNDLAVYYGSDFESTSMIANPVSATYYGITDYPHAYAEAAYLSRCNEYLIRTENWEADIDAIACTLGDIVDLQHDIPQWGDAGGRIVSATSITVTLDKQVTMKADQDYAIKIRTILTVNGQPKEVIQELPVQGYNDDTATNTITMLQPFTVIPQQYDIFAFGIIGSATKPFKVTNIAKSGDQKVTITGVEYVEAVYDESLTVPVRNYSGYTFINLRVTVTEILALASTGSYVLAISWIWPTDRRLGGANVYLNGNKVGAFKITDAGQVITTVHSTGTYAVSVDLFDSLGVVIGNGSLNYSVDTVNYLPASLTGVSATKSGSNVILTFTSAADIESLGVEVRVGSSWASGQVVTRASGSALTEVIVPAIIGTATYWVCPYNATGYATTPVSDTITFSTIPSKYQQVNQTAYEETATITGAGSIISGVLVQNSASTYGSMSSMTYGTMQDMTYAELEGGTGGAVTVTGVAVDMGKVCSFTIIPVETWLVAPDIQPVYQYQTSTDNVTWGAAKPLSSGQVTGRYFKVIAVYDSSLVPFQLSDLTVQAVADEVTQTFANKTIAVGGTTITYPQAYINLPSVTFGVLGGASLFAVVTNNLATGFKLQLLNASGTDIGGTVNITAIGF